MVGSTSGGGRPHRTGSRTTTVGHRTPGMPADGNRDGATHLERPAVTASVAAARPAWVRTVRRKVEMTSVLVKGVDVARDGRSHLTAAPPTCGHQATSRQGREKNDSSEDMQRPLIDRWI